MPYIPPNPPYPPLEIPDGFGEARARFLLPNGDEALITFGYTVDPAKDGDQAATELVASMIGVTPNLLGLISANTLFDRLFVTQQRAAVMEIGEEIVSTAGAGSTATTPPAVCALVQKRTGLAGRGNKGRFYLPQPAEAEVDDQGLLSVTRQGEYQDWADAFWQECFDDGMQLVLLHRDNLVVPRTTPDTYTAADAPTLVTSLAVVRKTATQRRRNNP